MAMGRANRAGRRGWLVQGLQTLRQDRRDEMHAYARAGVRIRDAEPRDCAAIAEMANDLARTTGIGDGGMTAHRVERDILNGEGLFLIAGDLNDEIAGYALYNTAYDTAHAARGVYLSDLFVESSARRNRVGQALMAELAWRAQEDGGSFIWWIVMPGNPRAGGLLHVTGS